MIPGLVFSSQFIKFIIIIIIKLELEDLYW